MTSPGGGFEIAEGHLTIDADTSPADRALLRFFRETDRHLEAAERAAADHGEGAGRQFGFNLVQGNQREMGGFFRDLDGRLRDARGRFAKEGDEIGRTFSTRIRRGFQRDVDRNWGRAIFAHLGDAIGSGLTSLGRGLSGAWSGLASFGEGIVDVGKKLGDFGSKLSEIGGPILSLLQIGLIAGAIPAIAALGSALGSLLPLLLLIPAAIAGLVFTILPLVVAFKGMGEAIKAMVSGDLNAFNEQLKKLAPSAAAVLREIRGLLPALRGFGRAVQEAFFAPLRGAFTPLVKYLFPTLQAGFVTVAGALGRFARGFLDLLHENDIIVTFRNLFASIGRVIDGIGPPLINLFGTLFGVMEHALPFVERIFAAIGRGLDRFAAFLSDAMSTGKFEQWLETAFTTMKDLFGLLGALGDLLATIFGGGIDEGQTFIQMVTEAVQHLADFLKTAEGQRALQALYDSALAVGQVIMGVSLAIANVIRWVQAFSDAIGAAVGWVQQAWQWLVNLEQTIEGAVAGAFAAVTAFFVGFGAGVAATVQAVVGWLGQVVDWFAALPGRIWAWLSTLPGVIRAGLVAAFDQFFFMLGYVGASVAVFVMSIPERFRAMWNMVSSAFASGVQSAIFWLATLPARAAGFMASLWSTVVSWTSNTVHSVSAWLSQLPGVVSRWFSDTWGRARSNTVSGVSNLMSVIRSIPGQVMGAMSGAASWLYSTGQNIIRGLINGITSMVRSAVDAVVRALGDVIAGAKRRLGIGSPSKVFAREIGRWIPPGIAVGVKAQMPALERYIGTAMDNMVAAAQLRQPLAVPAPAVSVGDTRVMVLLDGEQVGARIYLDPRRVSDADAEGDRRRAFLQTGRSQ